MSESITICIPTFNRAHLIARALECALGQTHDNFSVLVYDDASSDNTRQIVKKHGGGKTCYVRGDKNLGECRVRSLMVDMVKTDYLAWLDSDDLCNRHRLKMQLKAMKDHDAPWCRVDSDAFRKDYAVDWKELPRSRERLEFVTPSTMVRTDIAKKLRHRPYLFGCDTIWELEALRDFKAGIVIHRVLYYYMMHDPSRVSKLYPKRSTFDADMADQRAYRQSLLNVLKERGIPFRGHPLSEEYTKELVATCCS